MRLMALMQVSMLLHFELHRAVARTYIGHDVSILAFLSQTILFLAVSTTSLEIQAWTQASNPT